MIWKKYKDERLLVGIDWSLALGDDTIIGDPIVAVIGEGSLTASLAQNDGYLTKVWLEEGDLNGSQRVSVIVNTSDIEILEAKVSVFIME